MNNEKTKADFTTSYEDVLTKLNLSSSEFLPFEPFFKKYLPNEVFSTIREVQSVLAYDDDGIEDLKDIYHFYYLLSGLSLDFQNTIFGLVDFDSDSILGNLKAVTEMKNSLSYLDRGFYYMVNYCDFMQIHKDILHDLKTVFFNYYQTKLEWKFPENYG